MELPTLPVPISEFLSYVDKHKTRASVAEAVEPFKVYESKLREIFAQQPHHAAATADHLVPVFEGRPITIRARDVKNEPDAEREQYLLSLSDELRRKDGSPATVETLKDFKTNFNLFSESSLVDLDWSNVIAAGSSVATSLLPVDAPHNESKRALRSYYHETLAPASDVDLFIYGLDEKQAVEKIKNIESRIRDSILSETTTIRTKNTITIVSEYPTRHVQIVLRLYKSISEVLTGFDVDCACVAYDGQQVYASPRALAAYMTQSNTIDLTRRSPSYENRLSKYSHRGFEVHWPGIERSRIDPTIFERAFNRVQGLARLLVLEKLPHPNDRDTYLAQRRQERGRPPLPWNSRYRHELQGNVKDSQPEDVAEWVEEDDVSSYHTFTIPYGPKYNAKKIEKLLFKKDLLLNAEWNKPKDRETNLHRHPAFFGSVEDVIHDCCGFCPVPETDEDLAAAEEEGKIYISGEIAFLKDDPGRQAIGSFHPITDTDWTEMAYVGNTSRLCQSIVDNDLEAVTDWFSSVEEVDVNRRDHTGRTPLQLAAWCSTPEIVQCLIEHGARIVSRLYNGMTALHIAAHRGDDRIVKLLLDKSASNEEEESRKEEARKQSRRKAASKKESDADKDEEASSENSEEFDSDEDMEDEDSEDVDNVTEGSFVKVEQEAVKDALADDKDEPDFYDVDVLAWDNPLSPLHLAIIAGNVQVVDLLIDEYGADVLLPVKLYEEYNKKAARAAILPMVLALELPLAGANRMIKSLLSHGATPTQADMNNISALHYAVADAKAEILKMLYASNPTVVSKASNIVTIHGGTWNPTANAPLLTAIRTGEEEIAQILLKMGAKLHIDFETFAQAYSRLDRGVKDPDRMQKIYKEAVEQPVVVAIRMEMVELAMKCIEDGEDVNTLTKGTHYFIEHNYGGEKKALLDLVQDRIEELENFVDGKQPETVTAPGELKEDAAYLKFEKGSYQYWTAYHDLRDAKLLHEQQLEKYKKRTEQPTSESNADKSGQEEKLEAVKLTLSKLISLKTELLSRGAKTIEQLRPDLPKDEDRRYRYHYHRDAASNSKPYETNISFKIPDLTPQKREEYIQLFEAAWVGDTNTVKALCMSREQPLKIAISDLRGFTPFSVAALRGHLELAHLIVEIATVQYKPSDKKDQYHYKLRTDDPDDYYSEDSDSDASDGDIVADLIDEDFTVDDVVALTENVKSEVSPATMVSMKCQISRAFHPEIFQQYAREYCGSWSTPIVYVGDHSQESWNWFNAALENSNQNRQMTLIRYAILADDARFLQFLLKLNNDLAARKEDDDALKVFTVNEADFTLAVRLGRIEMIGDILKSTGFGLPLEKLVESSGAKLDEKPKYYQGLTVHGQKRKDWAEASRGTRSKKVSSDIGVPLLHAIAEGNVETIDYFLSDAPMRRYTEFANAFKHEKRIQALEQMDGGISGALTSWLSTRNDLAMHAGVLSRPNKEQDGLMWPTVWSQPALDLILEKFPECLEVRSVNGKTPLHLAFETGSFYAIKNLIKAGADQTARDESGKNILHVLLSSSAPFDHKLLREIFALLDQKLIKPLLLEKCSNSEQTGTTPLAMFMDQIGCNKFEEVKPSLEFLLSHSGGKDLEIMNGAGNYPLHTAVGRHSCHLVRFIAEFKPELLYWENATGMIPLDAITNSYLRSVSKDAPTLTQTERWSVTGQPPEDFIKSQKEREDRGRSAEWKTNTLIRELMAQYPAKRKLVSLQDANEVAKRLAAQQQKKNEENRRRERLGLNTSGLYTGQRQRYRYNYEEGRYMTEEEMNKPKDELSRLSASFPAWEKPKEDDDEIPPQIPDLKENPFFPDGKAPRLIKREWTDGLAVHLKAVTKNLLPGDNRPQKSSKR